MPGRSFVLPFCGGTKTVQRKIVIIGDGACGKTSLLNVFTRGYFPTVYEPTVFENYVHDIFVDNVHIELSLWDTAGQEEFDRLRSLSYDDAHAIMLCYSVDSKQSFENVSPKWSDEIKEACPSAKLILIALKTDLRDKALDVDEKKMIQTQDGLDVKKAIGALGFVECSAKDDTYVNKAFTEAARVALSADDSHLPKRRSRCCVM